MQYLLLVNFSNCCVEILWYYANEYNDFFFQICILSLIEKCLHFKAGVRKAALSQQAIVRSFTDCNLLGESFLTLFNDYNKISLLCDLKKSLKLLIRMLKMRLTITKYA